MTVVDYDLLVRSVGNQIITVALAVVITLVGTRIVTAIRSRDWRFFASIEGLGLTGLFLKNFGDAVRSAWTWWVQMYRIHHVDPDFSWPIVIIAGYLAPLLTIVGCVMLVLAFVPERWGNRGMLVIALATLALVLGTYLPMLQGITLRY